MECSYDQRCLRVEFVADVSFPLGDCNLIDIPIQVLNAPHDFDFNPDADTFSNTIIL